jgi:diguanylate cyclase (GGDEF)-like protein
MPELGAVADRVAVLPADLPVGELEAIIRADPDSLGVIADDDGTLYVLDRPYLETVFAGRLGYGRAVLHRRPMRAVLRRPALVLPAGTEWDDAARRCLDRPNHDKATPVVVQLDDGGYGLAPVGPLVEYLSERYAELALTDALTGLGNRSRLAEAAEARSERHFALLLLDLDRFKEINDALGHASGDLLLRRVARSLGGLDAFRLGGDEFVVLIDDPGDLLSEGRRILSLIRGPFLLDGVPVTVEGSVGIARTAAGRRTLGALLAGADVAMAAAKRDRTGVEVWGPELAGQGADLRLLAELREGIDRGELVLHYQPLVDARTGRTRSLEALVRWNHPRRGLLAPGVFVPAAERSEVIVALTERVLADAIAQAASWPVPLAAPVLARDAVVEVIAELLERHRLPPGRLIVEVTESAVMTQPGRCADRLRRLRSLGVRVAMDDFGTGYTSLALLTELPLDELKLDRSFVERIGEPSSRAIVDAVARMAKGLRLTLVAEGVEDRRTAEILAAAGFDLLQGYHFGRPMSADRVPRAAAV